MILREEAIESVHSYLKYSSTYLNIYEKLPANAHPYGLPVEDSWFIITSWSDKYEGFLQSSPRSFLNIGPLLPKRFATRAFLPPAFYSVIRR